MNKNERNVILSIDNLKKYFVNHGFINKAVDGVSFDLHEGEIVGLIGESGSGKTTVGRTILRLYDDFNGFVRLEDKIISGKKISNRLKRFLHKNVQMIFQDPHASLNSQQNVFSILREPLLVNGIIKSQIQDIFSDWFAVKQAFKYSFHIKALELKLENLKIINSLGEPLLHKWKETFTNFSFDPEIDFDDNFTNFFGYLDEKQQVESQIINNMYSNSSKLMTYYYEKQKQYRNKEIADFMLELEQAKATLAEKEQLAKMSKAAYQASKDLAKVKQEYKEFKVEQNEFTKNAKNVINNYVVESKNEKSLINITRLMSTDLEYYLFNLKNELLFAQRAKTLKALRGECDYLNYDETRELINEFDAYIKKFYQQHLDTVPFAPQVKKELLAIIAQNFHFDYSKFVTKSQRHKAKFEAREQEFQERMRVLTNIIAQNATPEISPQELEQARQNLVKAKETYQTNRLKGLVDLKREIIKLSKAIKVQEIKYNELLAVQTFCNERFDEIKEEYFKFIEEMITNNPNRDNKDIVTVINSYKSDLAVREDTLNSFSIERKYLNKDINNIYILLGVNYKWIEKNLEGLDLESEKQVNVRELSARKWELVYNFYDHIYSIPLAKRKISNLLYKTTIYDALESVGLLKQFAYRYPHEFSGGQLQRIVIARALITQPKVIVADEPIASLDISIQAQVVNLLKDLCLKKNIGLIFIAHDLSMIEYIADNVQIMHLGKIVEHGRTEKIYAQPYHPYTVNLFKAIPKISNANEKFQNVSFDLDYLDEQQFPNVPENYQVEEEHFVYGTKTQVQKWINAVKQQDN
ncbi:ATP-binding cassette domain-containing protein [Mycoplasmopsis columbinasalis]|uniref:Phosphate ABC transporter ATP-binding protein n=1 Tax=Mycoplasmopsis columbinasalis TaxID=114880 RepID=A0A449B9U5_9BACT|nr:ATP-binding cassette domain-containing protein [Mycoplasmopsis columbinasalis]VEU77926.1 phosphate ABC transporter ATP-binding protein [Mycoplasmopsis columbinasalis]